MSLRLQQNRTPKGFMYHILRSCHKCISCCLLLCMCVQADSQCVSLGVYSRIEIVAHKGNAS